MNYITEGKKYEVYYTAVDIFGNFFPSDEAEIEMTKTFVFVSQNFSTLSFESAIPESKVA